MMCRLNKDQFYRVNGRRAQGKYGLQKKIVGGEVRAGDLDGGKYGRG